MIVVDELVEAACVRVEGDDFGEDSWQEGLDVLVEALNTEGSLNQLGERIFSGQIIDCLANRLQIEQWYEKHPEINEQEIVAPLFGLGMPRTGSTALSFLMACDHSRRCLRSWEAGQPCPPPDAATEDTDSRIAKSQAEIDMTISNFPQFSGMLPSSATGPQECLVIMGLDFRSQVFEGMALLPSYTSWLLTCDMEPVYRYHKRVLQLLQWRCPPTRWWLKTPSHMASIDALDAVYPDARFVMTHRDIGQVIPSVCALKRALGSPVSGDLNLFALGSHETALWSESLRRLIEFRDGGRKDRFFDVAFEELQRDPIGAIERLYAALDEDLEDETRKQMIEWWQETSKDRQPGHRPDPADFGLNVALLRHDFAFYHDRFGITAG